MTSVWSVYGKISPFNSVPVLIMLVLLGSDRIEAARASSHNLHSGALPIL